MKIPELLDGLQDAGGRLAAAATDAGWDAPTPTCPGWTVRDLVFHTGSVHRWAATIVRTARKEPMRGVGGDPLGEAEHRPTDGELLDWFVAGHSALLLALRDAPPEVECWSFLPAPSPLLMWARRQAHETTVHAVDAEFAAGTAAPVDPAFAADGIDELLTGFVPRRSGKLRMEQPKTLVVATTDTPASWHLSVSDEPVAAERTDRPREADATVRGPASDVYLALWNRLSFGAVDAVGDSELLGVWPKLVQVNWT